MRRSANVLRLGREESRGPAGPFDFAQDDNGFQMERTDIYNLAYSFILSTAN